MAVSSKTRCCSPVALAYCHVPAPFTCLVASAAAPSGEFYHKRKTFLPHAYHSFTLLPCGFPSLPSLHVATSRLIIYRAIFSA
jgi:hypothetical protein